jgi:urease accessory protein
MLVEAPMGQLDDPDGRDEAWEIDWVDVSWQQCASRAFRRTSRGGRELRFLLRLGVVLKQGDIIWRDQNAKQCVAVNVEPCAVLVARPGSIESAVSIAFELGNLHLPLQFSAGEIVSIDDGPVQEVLEMAGVPFTHEMRRFEPTSRGTLQITLAESFQVIRRP